MTKLKSFVLVLIIIFLFFVQNNKKVKSNKDVEYTQPVKNIKYVKDIVKPNWILLEAYCAPTGLGICIGAIYQTSDNEVTELRYNPDTKEIITIHTFLKHYYESYKEKEVLRTKNSNLEYELEYLKKDFDLYKQKTKLKQEVVKKKEKYYPGYCYQIPIANIPRGNINYSRSRDRDNDGVACEK